MKTKQKICRSCLLIVMLLVTQVTNATNIFWIASGPGDWSVPANWSTNTVPGPSDIVIFDGGGLGDCNININVDVAGIDIQAGYTTGTITQGANTMLIRLSGASFSGGIFTGGTADITVNSNFTLSGTSFTSTSTVLLIKGTYTVSSGSFFHNSGTVKFTNGSTITGSHAVHNVEFNAAVNSNFTIASGTELTIEGTLTISGAGFARILTGTINAQGDILVTNTSFTSGGSATLKIDGTADQLFSNSGTAGQGRLPFINIDKPSGTLTLSGIITAGTNWAYTQGIIDALTNNSTLFLNSGNTITGSHTLHNVEFNAAVNTNFTIASGTELTAEGTLTISGAGFARIFTGTINAKGDILVTNTSFTSGGSATLKI
ncbi:MAG: hypothetical protein COB85_09240, partial [Bacteroidetes bacterium]